MQVVWQGWATALDLYLVENVVSPVNKNSVVSPVRSLPLALAYMCAYGWDEKWVGCEMGEVCSGRGVTWVNCEVGETRSGAYLASLCGQRSSEHRPSAVLDLSLGLPLDIVELRRMMGAWQRPG